MSSAATTVFAAFFGDDTSFEVISDGLPGTTRTYSSFSDALDEIGYARIAGGIHFRFACDAAMQAGRSVANNMLATQMLRVHGNG